MTAAPSLQSLNLGSLPPIFVSSTHMDTHDLHALEEQLVEAGATLTYDIAEARIVLSKAERKRRAQFDLQSNGLWTEGAAPLKPVTPSLCSTEPGEPGAKRRKVEEQAGQDKSKVIVIDDESTEDEAEEHARKQRDGVDGASLARRGPVGSLDTIKITPQFAGDTVKVIKVEWFEHSVRQGQMQPLESYLTYEGRPIPRPDSVSTPPPSAHSVKAPGPSWPAKTATPKRAIRSIIERAKADAPTDRDHSVPSPRAYGARRAGQRGPATTGAAFDSGVNTTQYAHLLHETTSEHDEGISTELPEMPEWVRQGVKYACQRTTLLSNPNDDFLALLKQIKLARLLTNDEIGVRAYSTCIAAIAAYPHKLSNPREILALPGCDTKIANLFVEYANTGRVRAAADAQANDELAVLRLFYDIWGVGAATAREFYHDRGWRDLDDVVEFGWSALSRVQQIGVKFYDEFLAPIPRREVEDIAAVIHRHAAKVRDGAVQSLVVGGYRRGKAACGDVDIIVSHPDEAQTVNIVNDIVASLEAEGWITHTLLLATTTSQRGQQTLPFRAAPAPSGAGHGGFDTLDKALVVWQDPAWASEPTHPGHEDHPLHATSKNKKNPNVHRRVDIIVSPWRTVGCAVAGWSGGTTFQRDLRRYAKDVKGWKFDSSGIRERAGGLVVDVERFDAAGVAGRAATMVEAERRVFDGLGLVWREPWERCTG